VIIPSRSEMFLQRTIQDILEHREAETEVIAVLDGAWADPPVEQNERVSVIYVNPSVGQRGAANLGAKIAKGRYIMKCDAHVSFDQGFDRKMLEGFKETGDNVTAVPVMRNLHAFSWKCYHCGWKGYQSHTPDKCGDPKCGKSDRLKRKIEWIGKSNPQSVSYSFDSEPHFAYFNDYKKTEKYQKDLETGFTETMSLQGSCFMCTRKLYWKLKMCDEKMGNWGNQGIELACKTWLSGRKVLVNHNTWYAHMFRTTGDFSFPYELPGREVQKTKARVWETIIKSKLVEQKYPVSWLVERFRPPGWDAEKIAKLKEQEAK